MASDRLPWRPRLVTFDCGDTLLFDPAGHVDELRLDGLRQWLAIHRPGGPDDRLRDIYRRSLARCRAELAARPRPGAPVLVALLLDELGLAPPADARGRLEDRLDDPLPAAREVAPGAREALGALAAAGVRLGIVSNAGVKSGGSMRRHLDAGGLLAFFDPDCLAFSDECGCAKPDPAIFAGPLRRAGVEPGQAVHVGDRGGLDVAGARAAGMGAVRYRGLVDDAGAGPEADLVVSTFAELLAALGYAPR
ncbi:MAG: HAD family hydrolase [Chloroflexi bacterium]|nr:MAG: HAD family hydrolase [Chloroflexota bacterium]